MNQPRPLKILHLATHDGVYRGGAVQMCRMAAEQRRRGHDVTAMVHQSRRASEKRRAQDRESWSGLAESGVPVEFMHYNSLRGLWRLRAFIKRGGFDIVHAHRDSALICSWIAMFGMSRPRLVAQRGTISAPIPWARRAFRSSRVRRVVAVASAVRDALVAANVPVEKIRVVYGSVDLEKFRPRPASEELREKLGLPAGSPIVGSVSAFRKAKGFSTMVGALARVFERRPDAHAVFLGTKVLKKVTPMAKEAGIDARCRILDHQSNVADWLSIMDLTIIAATAREGLSGVLRESLAMGVPVISTDCAGNREIVRDRKTGLLVPPGDEAAFADAILWALDHPAEMKAMAEEGRRWVEERCSLAAQADQLEKVYREALER